MGNFSKAKQVGTHADYFPLPAFTPGPQGWNDFNDPNDLVCRPERTPGPLGFGNDAFDPSRGKQQEPYRDVPIAILSLRQAYHFMRSVSIAIEQQKRIKVEWKEYKDSKVLNTIYAVFFWKGGPGWAEVVPGDINEILKAADLETERRMQVFIEKAAAGPHALAKYLRSCEEILQFALQAIDETYKEVSAINRDARRETAGIIGQLAKVKFAADLFITFASLFAGGAGSAIDIGYGLITSSVKDLNGLDQAKVIALEGGEEAGDKLAEGAKHAIDKQRLEKLIENLEKSIEGYERELARYKPTKSGKIVKAARQAAQRLARRRAELAAAKATLNKLSKLKVAGKGLKIVFLALQVRDSYNDYREVMNEVEKDLE